MAIVCPSPPLCLPVCPFVLAHWQEERERSVQTGRRMSKDEAVTGARQLPNQKRPGGGSAARGEWDVAVGLGCDISQHSLLVTALQMLEALI